MFDSRDSNPFAAPQATSIAPGIESESHPEAEILQAVESVLAKTRFGFWAVALTSFGIAGFSLWQFIFVMTRVGLISPGLGNLIGVGFYLVAGWLAWRIIRSLKQFSQNSKPWAMNDVFAAHAAFWKYLGIVAVIGMAIMVPMVVLSLLLLV